MNRIEKQELHCHACGNYVQFDIDMSLDGNHVLECPKCKHEHCRVVKNGVITAERWDQRNGDNGFVFNVTGTTSSSSSTYDPVYQTYGGTGTDSTGGFMAQAWIDTGGTS